MGAILVRVAFVAALCLGCEPTDPPDDGSMPVDDAPSTTTQGWERCDGDDICVTTWADACPELDPPPGAPCTTGARCSYCREHDALEQQIEASCEGGTWRTTRAFCDRARPGAE